MYDLKLLDTAYQYEHSTFRGLCLPNLMVSNQTIGFVVCFSPGRAFLRARSRRVADIFLQFRFVFSHYQRHCHYHHRCLILSRLTRRLRRYDFNNELLRLPPDVSDYTPSLLGNCSKGIACSVQVSLKNQVALVFANETPSQMCPRLQPGKLLL